MASLSERLRAEGMGKGVEMGMAEGVKTGERAVLIRQLNLRFGPLSDETLMRLNDAGQQQLETWADRILDAGTLDEVFQDH